MRPPTCSPSSRKDAAGVVGGVTGRGASADSPRPSVPVPVPGLLRYPSSGSAATPKGPGRHLVREPGIRERPAAQSSSQLRTAWQRDVRPVLLAAAARAVSVAAGAQGCAGDRRRRATHTVRSTSDRAPCPARIRSNAAGTSASPMRWVTSLFRSRCPSRTCSARTGMSRSGSHEPKTELVSNAVEVEQLHQVERHLVAAPADADHRAPSAAAQPIPTPSGSSPVTPRIRTRGPHRGRR